MAFFAQYNAYFESWHKLMISLSQVFTTYFSQVFATYTTYFGECQRSYLGSLDLSASGQLSTKINNAKKT